MEGSYRAPNKGRRRRRICAESARRKIQRSFLPKEECRGKTLHYKKFNGIFSALLCKVVPNVPCEFTPGAFVCHLTCGNFFET